MKRLCTVLGAYSIVLIGGEACLGDKGGWHVHNAPVVLAESGQKAIIGWDGFNQILCLATDVSASRSTKVIEFIPLPSEPKVTLGNRESFDAVQKLLTERRIGIPKEGMGKKDRGMAGADTGEPFVLTFHERLGAHDVTVAKVNSAMQFAGWIEKKAREVTGTEASLPGSIRKLIGKYVKEYRCPFFVFDVIEVGPEPKSLDPLIYEFPTSMLYYPLEISSTFEGQTTIDLVVFSEERVDPDHMGKHGFRVSSAAWVRGEEMQKVLPVLNDLLGQSAMLQAFKYSGDIRSMKGNIRARARATSLKYTQSEYDRAKFIYFHSASGGLVFVGVVVTFACLWPMYFAAKRQQPRWGIRLLAGFLLGIPAGLAFILAVTWIFLRSLQPNSYRLYGIAPVGLVTCAMYVGFILFCFQLGLGRRWYLWSPVYAALAIPATLITYPGAIEDFFELELPWEWSSMCISFAGYVIVFMLLFFLAKLVVWKFTESAWGWRFMKKHGLLRQ